MEEFRFFLMMGVFVVASLFSVFLVWLLVASVPSCIELKRKFFAYLQKHKLVRWRAYEDKCSDSKRCL